MDTIAKIVFFFIAVIFIGSILNDADFSLSGSSRSSGGLTSRDTYLRSYDRNGDGVVSDAEYAEGESQRIEGEIREVQEALIEILTEELRSPYAQYFQIRNGNMRTEDNDREYITLMATGNLPSPVNITGWRVRSLVTGRGGYIRKGVTELDPVRPWRFEKDIFIGPGERAIITSGSAIGINTSFVLNSCTGYLEARRDFSPSIPRQCPPLKNENLADFNLSFNDFDEEEEYDDCMDAIERVSSCQIPSVNRSVVSECRTFIRDYATYKGCFELHSDDSDFVKGEWRIFLGSRDDLWRAEREAVAVYDQNNLVVGVIEY